MQKEGRLNVDGGNGQQPDNTYWLGGGAGGIIQIIAPEGSLAANTASIKSGTVHNLIKNCEGTVGHFLLKGNFRLQLF